MQDKDATYFQELRRGTAVLACLLALRTPNYGYALLEHLEAAGIEVEGNTLYPLLRRLEAQGLLTSEWNTDEARPRKFYSTTTDGAALAATLNQDFRDLSVAFTTLTERP